MAHALVVGGSLGGLMAANLLARAGLAVTVLEKANGPLNGRGAGIVTHRALERGLQKCGMPPDYALGIAVAGRVTLDSQGGVLGEIPMPQVLTSWSRLYQLLRDIMTQQLHALRNPNGREAPQQWSRLYRDGSKNTSPTASAAKIGNARTSTLTTNCVGFPRSKNSGNRRVAANPARNEMTEAGANNRTPSKAEGSATLIGTINSNAAPCG